MKNKTTYEMEDIMSLITRDLAEKGLAPDPGSVVVRVKSPTSNEINVQVECMEIDVNVSWVGVSTPPVKLVGQEAPEPSKPRDLLDEAPEPGVGPPVDIGDVTAASQQLVRSSDGPFSPDKVKKRTGRLTGLDGESFEYPGSTRIGGR